MQGIITKMKKHSFMFQELVKRDFKAKYKRTVLGMVWSILNPLLTLFVMRLVFTGLYGYDKPFYTTYLFAGNLMYGYFREATNGGMYSLMSNAGIFTKINVPKYLFLLSKNVSAVINFALTLVVFFVFAAIDGVPFHPRFLCIIFPIITMTLFNIGIGMILSALFVFFRDIQYIYDVFTMLLMYLSAIFYYVDRFPAQYQRFFLLNPVYCNIKFVRIIVIDGNIPSISFHLLLLGYAFIALCIGSVIYKTQNTKFLYYV
ncbi:MAG: ABC transporter permease [Lachnospiraceae bacterium]|nr:ABC transporter permease [Lachnospiraceae bacterium]